MGGGRKTVRNPPEQIQQPWYAEGLNSSSSARNLRKNDLGGAIFGCKDVTMRECLSKQLFGLPSGHISYVKNIGPGLPLFLFNYSNRTMHGLYEAASVGQLNIDRYAWTENGTERTPFPAQVRVCMKMSCQPLSEKQFKTVIEDNYNTSKLFWFELDHAQTKRLISLFRQQPAVVDTRQLPISSNKSNHSPPKQNTKCKTIESQGNASAVISEIAKDSTGDKFCRSSKASSNANVEGDVKQKVMDWVDWNENMGDWNDNSNAEVSESDMERVLHKLKEISIQAFSTSSLKDCKSDSSAPSTSHDMCKEDTIIPPDNEREEITTISDMQENGELVQIIKALTSMTEALAKKQAESDKELEQLRDVVKESERIIKGLQGQVNELESKLNPCTSFGGKYLEQCVEPGQVVYLIGGYDDSSWLSACDAFSPSNDKLIPLKSMSSGRSYAAVAAMDSNIFVFGGGDGNSWYNSVERYNLKTNEWTPCPNLGTQKGSLAGATLNNKIFAIGGGDGVDCYADVEMFDPILGRWIVSPSMLHKRFATGAVEHNGALYAVGGFDGVDYLMSAERYDPREGYWKKLPNMSVRRGCLSLSVLSEKIYAMGGYDGEKICSSVEILDPRLDAWMSAEPMNCCRGYAAAAVIGGAVYVIGGIKSSGNLYDTVECYTEGSGWSLSNSTAIGKRCFLSALAPP